MGGGVRQRSERGERAWGCVSSLGAEIWGVLNVTPDSFSDGGRFSNTDRAVAAARELVADGAHVVDVGGESTRPAGATYGAGYEAVSVEEELRRVLPVVEGLLALELPVRVSVDTTKAEVARRALRAGAHVINDVSAGRSEALLRAVAEAQAELVLMHNRGQGEVAGDQVCYSDVVGEVRTELLQAALRAEAFGVPRERILIDPGIGFAKTAEQSATLLGRIEALVDTGLRVLVGPSRKSFIGVLAKSPGGRVPLPLEREAGTAAAVTRAVLGGVHAVRVHDVRAMRQAVLVAAAMRGRATPPPTSERGAP